MPVRVLNSPKFSPVNEVKTLYEGSSMKIERQVAGLQRLGEDVERDTGRLQLVDDSDLPDVTLGESILWIRRQDGHLDQTVECRHIDPGLLGCLGKTSPWRYLTSGLVWQGSNREDSDAHDERLVSNDEEKMNCAPHRPDRRWVARDLA